MDTEHCDDPVTAAYVSCRPGLQRYLTSVTRDPWTAEDLVQEAFLRLTIEVAQGRIPDDPGGGVAGGGTTPPRGAGGRQSGAGRTHPVLEAPDDPASPEQSVVEIERRN